MRTDIPLREITIEEIWQEVQSLRSELQNHNHLSSGNSQVLTGTVEGILQSPNFISGSSGWQLLPNGNIEANDGNFRGDITGASGTFSGTLSAASGTLGDITAGTNAWHIDSSGNMWWGSDSSYANSITSNAPSISNTGLIKNVIFNNSSGNRIDLTQGNNIITLYSSSDYKSTIFWSDSELRLSMEQAGGYITLYSEDTEVLRGDKQDGVTIPASLMLNTYRVYINKIGATSGVALDIDNAGTSESLTINQTYNSNSSSAFSLTNEGTGRGLVFSQINTSATNEALYAEHKGTGYVASFVATTNTNRQKAAVAIFPDTQYGAHLHLEPGASTPANPEEGDIYADTDHKLYYYNGTAWKEIAFV